MTFYRLHDEYPGFPDPREAEPSGLLAVGGDLSPQRLLNAYALGIFPWFSEGDPPLWHCPDPRLVLFPTEFHIPRKLRKTLNRKPFDIRFDTDFLGVLEGCALTHRPGQRGTWITQDMRRAYHRMHRLGFAHSVEAWEGDDLVGGLYGIALGGVFFGESMFHRAPDASKAALLALVEFLRRHKFDLLDCQQDTPHMRRFGARLLSRDDFLNRLDRSLERRDTLQGSWAHLAQELSGHDL